MTERRRPAARAATPGQHAAPLYAVWEVTMHCDQPCAHCGSRAGSPRSVELDTEQALAVADALGEMGCREIALIGGEAYLRRDLTQIIARLASHGIRVGMQTGGRSVTPAMLEKLRAAGLTQLGVSVDGFAEVHDELRGNVGSHAATVRAMAAAKEVGLAMSANSQINRLNLPQIEALGRDLRERGALTWQVQLTVPMGRAADRPDWILEPWQVVDVIDALARVQLEAAREHVSGPMFHVAAGNNIGYFGPHEHILRSAPGGVETHWQGCKAGIYTIGIESDGSVKGCPSLPSSPYVGGNVLEESLQHIWNESSAVRFSRDRDTSELWGFCGECYYGDTCRAGCAWTTHCTVGRRGNNPFCYHRVKELERRGIRERLVQRERAANQPYDYGRFDIVEEPCDSPAPAHPRHLRVLPT